MQPFSNIFNNLRYTLNMKLGTIDQKSGYYAPTNNKGACDRRLKGDYYWIQIDFDVFAENAHTPRELFDTTGGDN